MTNKINLGCGSDIKEGYLNVDCDIFKGVDLLVNLEYLPYPFSDNQFEEVLMYNLLEHLPDAYRTMLEVHRITKSGGYVHIQTPHFSSMKSWGDLQHKRPFSTESFTNQNIRNKFEVVKQKIIFRRLYKPIEWLVNLNSTTQKVYEHIFAYMFQASYLDIKLRRI